MNYAEIKKNDIANGTGVRVSLFVSGCRHHCPDCFNSMAWDFKYGKPFTKEVEDTILEMLKPDYVQGLTLLGGEPFEAENQRTLVNFVKRVKETYPNKNIWCFTGFTYDEELLGCSRANCEVTQELLSYIDVLVDGRFEKELKNLKLKFRGSSNQRIIDLNKTREIGSLVLSPLNAY